MKRLAFIAAAWLLAVVLQFSMGAAPDVFAATHDVSIGSEDVFLIPTSGTLQVAERIDLTNSSGKVTDVQLPLPAGAKQVTVTNVPKASVSVNQHAVTLHAVQAGKLNPVVTFTISFSDQTSVQLTLHSNNDVALLHIYVPIGNAALSAPGLMTQTQTTQVAGKNFRVFTHGELSANSDFTMSLSLLPNVTSNQAIAGLPMIGTDSESAANTLQAVGNLVLAAAILVIALLGIRSMTVGQFRSKRPEDALFRTWEEVEQAHEAGHLSDEEYERRRLAIRRRISELTIRGRLNR